MKNRHPMGTAATMSSWCMASVIGDHVRPAASLCLLGFDREAEMGWLPPSPDGIAMCHVGPV